jgi:hypothetical protein
MRCGAVAAGQSPRSMAGDLAVWHQAARCQMPAEIRRLRRPVDAHETRTRSGIE